MKVVDGPINDSSGMKKNDLILMKYYGKKFPTHGGIYMENDLILHHRKDCYSRIEHYNNVFKSRTTEVVRHESLL